MPFLIPEVLEAIVAEFRHKGNATHPFLDQIVVASNSLSKFMLSGRKSFAAALNYFARADKIALWNNFFIVIVKNFSTDRYDEINKHYFNYDFIFIKSLLIALSHSNGTLEIHESLNHGEQNIVVEALLSNQLKKVTLFAKLNPKYFDMMKTKCSLEKIRAAYAFESNSSCFDILQVPASCHEINSSFVHERISLHNIPQGLQYPLVKELNIFDMDLNSVTANDLATISLRISESFPNLEKLYLVFNLANENTIPSSAAAIRAQAFQVLPPKIHGVIHFEGKISKESFKNVSRELSNDPAVKIDSINKIITKSIFIHDGLFAFYKINTYV